MTCEEVRDIMNSFEPIALDKETVQAVEAHLGSCLACYTFTTLAGSLAVKEEEDR